MLLTMRETPLISARTIQNNVSDNILALLISLAFFSRKLSKQKGTLLQIFNKTYCSLWINQMGDHRIFYEISVGRSRFDDEKRQTCNCAVCVQCISTGMLRNFLFYIHSADQGLKMFLWGCKVTGKDICILTNHKEQTPLTLVQKLIMGCSRKDQDFPTEESNFLSTPLPQGISMIFQSL